MAWHQDYNFSVHMCFLSCLQGLRHARYSSSPFFLAEWSKVEMAGQWPKQPGAKPGWQSTKTRSALELKLIITKWHTNLNSFHTIYVFVAFTQNLIKVFQNWNLSHWHSWFEPLTQLKSAQCQIKIHFYPSTLNVRSKILISILLCAKQYFE